ncbi:MAG TPA: drug/metabolite exporter YedA [Polyangiaceae bacterium]
MKRSSLVAYAVVCTVWGSTYLAIRIALEGFPPFFLGAVRFLAAGAILFAFARFRRIAAPRPVEWASGFATGVLFFVVGNGLVNVAEQSVSSGLASVLVATMPLWVTVYARLFGGRTSAREIGGVLLGLAGVVVLNLGGELRASPGGAAAALLAPMGWALGSVASQRLPLARGAMRTASQMLGGGAAMALVSIAMHEHAPTVLTTRAVVAVAYLTVFGSLVGFSAYSHLLATTRPAVATSYAYVNPVVAVLLGTFLAGEHLSLTSAAGAAVVLTAVVLVLAARARRPGQSRERASSSRSDDTSPSGASVKSSTTPDSPTTT